MQHQSVFKLHPVRLPVEPPLVSGHKADVAQAATLLLASSPGHSHPEEWEWSGDEATTLQAG